MNESYILSILIFSPLLAMLILLFTNRSKEKFIKWIGVLGTLPPLLLSLYIYIQYSSGASLSSFSQSVSWIQFLFENSEQIYSISYEVGLSGLSLAMITLTSLIATMAALASFRISSEWKGYYLLFLLLEIGMLGVFAAENLILFFIFFEITLVPMFFLIGKWGYFEKEKAAYHFLIYNGLGSAVLLIAIIILFARTGTTNYELLEYFVNVGGDETSQALKVALFVLIFLALGVKLPVFPLHSWMLRVHVQAPPAIVMIHSGILLKIGAYGLIRFGIGIFPEQFQTFSLAIAILGVINLLYGAYIALIQTDLKLVLAYSSISHMGIILIGLGALNEAGIQGATFQAVSHGFISALLFLMVSVFYERYRTTDLTRLGGTASQMPIASGILLAGGMASLGLPGTSGFISEFTAFLGIFENEPVIGAIGALGIILTACYVLRAVLKITFSKQQGELKADGKLQTYEYVPAFLLIACIIVIGVYPAILGDVLNESISKLMMGLGG